MKYADLIQSSDVTIENLGKLLLFGIAAGAEGKSRHLMVKLEVEECASNKLNLEIPASYQRKDLSKMVFYVDLEGLDVSPTTIMEISSNWTLNSTLIIINLALNSTSRAPSLQPNVMLYGYQLDEARGRNYLSLNAEGRLPYYLILDGPEGLTIFEHEARFKLQTELKTDPVDGQRTVSGFKISNSHFRLGSKIHIRDYYYAKRFFQHNAYSSPFAFLLAKTIIKDHISNPIKRKAILGDRKSQNKSGGLTLIGYGLYSEMLISIVEKLLSDYFATKLINHDIINDEEIFEPMKMREKLNANVIIIVPISSTFSTSVKIDESIKKVNPLVSIIEPHLNVLNVFDASERDGAGLTLNEAKFGWSTFIPAERTVMINALSGGLKKQLFYLQLPSKWYDIQDCAECFSKDPKEELPLFITDKTSVTPMLIFSNPRGRTIPLQPPFTVTPKMLKYGHYLSDHNHYQFYLEKQMFFLKNKAGIKTWLYEVKKKGKTGLFARSTNISNIIIAPGNYSNAGFVHMVNEVLFDSSADVIHYEPTQDHIQNFQSFYSEVINPSEKKRKSRVFFVDDTLLAGSNFIKTNYLVKHSRDKEQGFDGCIIMLDRSSSFSQQNVVRKLTRKGEGFFAFASLHLASINDVDNTCPLCKEQLRYETLAENSFLDTVKLHFLKQASRLDIRESKIGLLPNPPERFILKVLANHYIYDWFSYERNAGGKRIEDFETFEEWKVDLINTYNIKHTNLGPFKKYVPAFFEAEALDDALLKTLTQSPLTHYKPVKQKVFKWVIDMLDSHRLQVLDATQKNRLQYKDFRRLKFLIRRAAMLNANYLISETFFKMLAVLLSKNGIPKLISDKSTEQEQLKRDRQMTEASECDFNKQTLKNFTVFFIAQVKELLLLNEAKSIQLELTLLSFQKKGSEGFKQLVRMLSEENGILFQQFIPLISGQITWNNAKREKDAIASIKEALDKESVKTNYRYNTLLDFVNIGLSTKIMELSADVDFMRYVFLHNLLGSGDTFSEERSRKTELLMASLHSLALSDRSVSGLFFLVKYKSGDGNQIYFAHNHGSHGAINEFNETSENKYLMEFLKGIPDRTKVSNITVEELARTNIRGKSAWKSLYALDEAPKFDSESGLACIPASYNRLFLLRINKRSLKEDEGQGIIGFYFNQEDDNTIRVQVLRYLLLLRPLLSLFIQKHHENYEFNDWMIAQAHKRNSMLTGHGREMLIRISQNPEYAVKYKKILSTIAMAQLYILDMKEMNMFSSYKHTKEDFIRFFDIKDDTIEKEYITDHLSKLTEEIFEMNEIENSELVIYRPGSLIFKPFKFSRQILDSILFELLVNAKKNRYIFLDDYPPGFIQDDSLEKINKISVSVSESKDGLIRFRITNTCAKCPSRTLNGINNSGGVQNGKLKKDIAGIELISTMLRSFELGRIVFKQDHVEDLLSKDLHLYNFHAILELNPN
ncbi:hypothetical protein [Pedobacter duraquae]|uniref:Uncharacterized protein n=1 Tax=Pedobacter duraquae TaxID=425511 RepID=A0A4R6IEC5_9SPHI|nr:hypothetical protein [Pedobacter duraquae]TDO20324.1 hypothetical protein CLV32_4084 [Pedobacter duraquae]